jgi:hypothetical protein
MKIEAVGSSESLVWHGEDNDDDCDDYNCYHDD